MGRVENKVAVVTGGSHGIGRATCLRLAEEGAAVAVTDVLEEDGRAVAREIRDAGGEARFWRLDVSDEKEVQSVFGQIGEEFGAIDILVNNAGISGADKPTDELSEAEWDEVLDVNVKGVAFCTKYAVPYMREQGGGSIVNLSSIYGIIGAADVPPYHASKGAVRMLTKTDALTYAEENIRVNSVHPGFIWTPMVEDFAKRQEGGVEAVKEHLETLHPVGHLGESADIANGILFLASEESKFMTGSELVIDGGYTAR